MENKNFGQPIGEITGSVSVTSTGELWLEVMVEQWAILSKVEVVESLKSYQLTMIACTHNNNHGLHQSGQIQPNHTLGKITNVHEATVKVLELLKVHNIQLEEMTKRAIPFVIQSAWREPSECKRFIDYLIEQHSKEKS